MSRPSKPAAAAPQPLLKQLLLTALLIAATCYSALRAYSTPLSDGPTKSQVWWFGWVTMLSTGVGAIPMFFVQGAPARALARSRRLCDSAAPGWTTRSPCSRATARSTVHAGLVRSP
jgi:hypothetical protein